MIDTMIKIEVQGQWVELRITEGSHISISGLRKLALDQLDPDFNLPWEPHHLDRLLVKIAGRRTYIPTALVHAVNTTITEKERQTLICRYQYEFTLERAGKHFGVTRERIRQIEAKALRKLRHPSRSRLFLPPEPILTDGGIER